MARSARSRSKSRPKRAAKKAEEPEEAKQPPEPTSSTSAGEDADQITTLLFYYAFFQLYFGLLLFFRPAQLLGWYSIQTTAFDDSTSLVAQWCVSTHVLRQHND
jgi:hypothetical protein